MSVEHDIRFPGESEEYRRERNSLLDAEVELRRAIERVAAQRRALPPGGAVPDDYRFEEVSGGGELTLSELFAPGSDTLVIYSFMFPRYSGDKRPGPGGETVACRWRRPRARRAPRSSTRLTAPPRTWPGGSISRWWRKPPPSGY